MRDISKLGIDTYNTYVGYLAIDAFQYCTQVNPKYKQWYETLGDDAVIELTMYALATQLPELSMIYSYIFNFFFVENVIYDKASESFLVFKVNDSGVENGDLTEENITKVGYITGDVFSEICDILLQIAHSDSSDRTDFSKIKSEKSRKFMLELMRRKQAAKEASGAKKSDENMAIGNVVSAVCAKSQTLGYHNIWDITIYQLWDSFNRLVINDHYEINKTSISVWGDEKKQFDPSTWYKKLKN